ncbi:MAG TPA: DNA repair protein RecO [Polyangia bacterium]|nr:DNA repair protein RecO [Polyangia bacterium]
MTSLSTPAILLRAINYGESDRVVTLIGRTTGRLSALARGARKSQKRFGGGLGLCSVGAAALRERAGAELLTLEHFDLEEGYASFATDLARMAHAAYVAELVSKLCAPRQAETEVYDWLHAFLGALDSRGASAERLRIFELGLLTRLGFGPMVDSCAVCGGTRFPPGVPAAEIGFRWDPGRGGAICGACGQKGRPIRSVVRLALARWAGQRVDVPARDDVPADVNRGARDAIAEVFKLHMSGPLQSLEFIAKMGGDV